MKKNYLNPLSRLLPLLLVLLVGSFSASAADINVYGDVNLDGEVTIADVNSVIDVILNNDIIPTADVNTDGEINIADVNTLIDIILNGGIDPFLVVCKRVAEIDLIVSNYYMQCKTLEELKEFTDEIEALDGVEYVFFDEHTSMFVKYKDFGIVSYSYYSEPVVVNRISHVQQLPQEMKSIFGTANIDEPKMVIANQQVRDESRIFWAEMSSELKGVLGNAGFKDPVIEENLDLDFYRNEMFQYDYVFLITHGSYVLDPVESWINPDQYHGLHWLFTSVEVPLTKSGVIDEKELARLCRGYDEDEVSWGTIKETRNGIEKKVAYLKVSENFISSSDKNFKHPGKGIVFNTACQSMMGPHPNAIDSINTSLARVFELKGAAAYFGYDEADSSGKPAGFAFWGRLLSGMSIINAINDLQFEFWHDYRIKDNGKPYWADLVPYYPNQEFRGTHICEPLVGVEDLSDENSLNIILHGRNVLDYYNANYISQERFEYGNNIEVSNIPFKYGFELSESELFTNAITVCEKSIGGDGCEYNEDYFIVNYSESLTEDASQSNFRIKPETTYWARSFVYDGNGYNYSEPISFTTGSLSDNPYQGEPIPVGDTGLTINMVKVGGGTFTMGATEEQSNYAYDDEYPAHEVTLSDFYIGQTEVTVELYCTIMNIRPSSILKPNYPIMEISWDDAQTFISRLNNITGMQFRLPTEAEWEYAARGGNKSMGYVYSGSDDINEVGWYKDNVPPESIVVLDEEDNYYIALQPVGSLKANELGIYDMTGNVYEWCQDCYDSQYYSSSPSLNPYCSTFSDNYIGRRVIRGGCFDDDAKYCRVSYREYQRQHILSCLTGMRLAI